MKRNENLRYYPMMEIMGDDSKHMLLFYLVEMPTIKQMDWRYSTGKFIGNRLWEYIDNEYCLNNRLL